MDVAFVTGNKGKLEEVRHALAPAGVRVTHLDLKPVEIQADTLEEVAREKAAWVAARHDGAFLIDDAGLFVDALHGFPGVYSAHALKTLGVAGLLKLLDGERDRRARFECVLALQRPDAPLALHAGAVAGRVADAPRERGHGFGFDPVFIPDGFAETFAELPLDVKNRVSHRGRALASLLAAL